jgi:endonuclease YncB( thermonuclease family)
VSTALTRVSLLFVDQRMNVYLRFGRPQFTQRIDRRRSCVYFSPGAVFCRIGWEANEYGTTRWELMVLQGGTPWQSLQRVVGVTPGATLLLHVRGPKKVPFALQLIDAIEAQQIHCVDVAPGYWRTVHNRLAGRTEAAVYTPEQHAAHLLAETLV